MNDLYLFVRSHGADGVERRSRSRFLEQVIRECHLVRGVLVTSMSHDEAYEMLSLGANLERADMTTRILDTRAVALLSPGTIELDTYRNVQWTGVLRSLSALQMFHRAMHRPVDGPSVVRFLLTDRHFPRSVAHCLRRIDDGLTRLPRSAEVRAVVDGVLGSVVDRDAGDLGAEQLRARLDEIQLGLAALHDRIGGVYFTGTPDA